MQFSTVSDTMYLKVRSSVQKPRTIDTRKHGRPDMVKLALKAVTEFDAEAVGVISNKPLTEKVVYGLTSRGIPAYGAIFDS